MPDGTNTQQKAPKSFALIVPDRKRATLIPILKYKIEEKSIIWSDGWSSYFCLRSHFGGWDWVSHTLTFMVPETGVNTNRCEGQWTWLKNTIPAGARRRDIEEYVQLYNFKQWAKNHKDIEQIGLLGLMGRANQKVTLIDKGRHGLVTRSLTWSQP